MACTCSCFASVLLVSLESRILEPMAPKKALGKAKAKSVKNKFAKKALGKAKDKKALEKAKDKKALEKAKAQKPKALGKALGKAMKAMKSMQIKAKDLEKLGSMTLDQKIKKALEEGETQEESAEILKKSMAKLEHSKVWAKHKAALEKAPAKEQEHDKLSKKDKGLAASQWLLEKEGKKYMSALKKVKAEETVTRRDKWETELQMLQKFSQEELERHLASGRIIWREDPRTPYTYEYKDLADYEKVVKGKRGKEWSSGVEFDPEEEDLEKFLQLYNTEAVSGQLEAGGGTGLGKGQPSSLGKGQPSSLGKGRGKRSKRDLPALTNGEPEKEEEDDEEETALEKAMKAARTARNMLTATKEDLELALEKAQQDLEQECPEGSPGTWH